MSLSCIVPMGPQEEWTDAVTQKFLSIRNAFDEIIFVGTDHTFNVRLPPNFRRLTSQRAQRAHQMNLGALDAKSTFLSFLHFDSEFDSEIFSKLRLGLKENILYYFDLEFSTPAPALCKINSWAANLRADYAKLPLGDQCFTLSKKNFLEVGSFDENLLDGEDAEFVRRWQHKGFAIKKAKGAISTSPRYFQQHGWLKTTARHAAWTVRFWAGKEPRSA